MHGGKSIAFCQVIADVCSACSRRTQLLHKTNKLVWNCLLNNPLGAILSLITLSLWCCVSDVCQVSRALAGASFICEKEVTGLSTWAAYIVCVQHTLCHQRWDTGSEETFVCFLFPVCDVTKNFFVLDQTACSAWLKVLLLAVNGFVWVCVCVYNLSFLHIRVIDDTQCFYQLLPVLEEVFHLWTNTEL